MVMRGKQCSCAQMLSRVDVLGDCPGDAQAVVGARPAPYLIQENKALPAGAVEDLRGFQHFDHERASAGGEIVGSTDSGKNSVYKAYVRFGGWDEAANLREQDNQRDLPQIGALSSHVRSGQNDQAVAVLI